MAKRENTNPAISVMTAIEKLIPNPWNTNVCSPENEHKLEASIKRFGMYKPIICRELVSGALEIIGGQHRWEAAKRLGFTQIPTVNLGLVEDKKAKEIGLVDNGRYGEDDTLALSALLKELGSTAELTTFLPYSELDLNNIFAASSIALDSLDLPPNIDEAPLSSRPAPTHQVMRFKVPVEDIAWVTVAIEKCMRDKNFTADDSLSNAGQALIELLKPYK